MSEQISERVQFNVRITVNLLVLAAYLGLLAFGVSSGALSVKEALALIGSTALGGGVGWFSRG